MDESAFREHRAEMKAQMTDELDQLRRDADDGTMEASELRRRLTSLVDTYLGGASPATAASLENVMTQYERLHTAVERKQAIEEIARSLGLDV